MAVVGQIRSDTCCAVVSFASLDASNALVTRTSITEVPFEELVRVA